MELEPAVEGAEDWAGEAGLRAVGKGEEEKGVKGGQVAEEKADC